MYVALPLSERTHQRVHHGDSFCTARSLFSLPASSHRDARGKLEPSSHEAPYIRRTEEWGKESAGSSIGTWAAPYGGFSTRWIRKQHRGLVLPKSEAMALAVMAVSGSGTGTRRPFRPGGLPENTHPGWHSGGYSLLPDSHNRGRSQALSTPGGTSSVHTRKLSSVLGPKVVLIATSDASRPRAISTRPIRGVLLRASKVYQLLPG
jgi:hypothetical protein